MVKLEPISTSRSDVLLIFIGCLGLFLFSITSNPEFVNFQTRFAVFAQEMLRNGPSFFPTTYNIPYPDYPATSTFLIYLLSLPFHQVTSFTATFPTALTSALIAVMTYKIGALQNRAWGWYSVIFLLFTATFLAESRTIALDQYVSLVTVTSFYIVYSETLSTTSNHRLFWLPVLFILGFAFRGPIGLIVPSSIVCGYYLLERSWRRFFFFGFLSAFLLVMCFGILLWGAYLDGGPTFLQDVINMQVASRVHIITKNPWAYYFVNSFADYAITYPLAVLLTIGLIPTLLKQDISNKREPFHLIKHVLLWALIILIGFSFANSKRNHYILPLAPPLALLCASLFATKEYTLNAFLFSLKKLFLNLCTILPGLIAVLLIGAWFYARQIGFSITISVWWIIFCCFILQGTVIYFKYRSLPSQKQPILLSIGVTTFILLQLFILEPINYSLNITRDFVYHFEEACKRSHAKFGFYDFGRDALAIKFMANLPPAEIAAGIEPLFIDNQTALFALNKKVFFITKSNIYNEMPESIKSQLTLLSTNKIGHEPIVVFAVTKYLEADDVHAFR